MTLHPSQDSIHFRLHPREPFRLDLTAWALRRRAINAVDAWDGATYRRVLPIGKVPALISVSQKRATLNVSVTARKLPPGSQHIATHALERLLGIREDLSNFYEFSSIDPRLRELALRFRGFKPPRFPTVFEGLVNGITCQQLSLAAGLTFLNRLAEHYGLAFAPGQYAFPRPADLAALEPAGLRPLGYSGSKARALIGVARSIASGDLDLERLNRLDNQRCLEQLIALKGVGRWTAEYVLLRGLGRTSVFPGDDVGAQNGLAHWLHLRARLDYKRVERVLSKWKQYGGLIFFHLLLKGLTEAGAFSEAGAPDRRNA